MEKYSLIFKEDIPKYIQLETHIKSLIDKGIVEDGEKLPSIRELASFLKVNNVTIQSAFKKLQQEGYATMKMGSGTYAKKKEVVRRFKREYAETFKKLSSSRKENFIDFTGEAASGTFFPVNEFKQVLNEVLDRDGAEALVYQESIGYEGLRESINNFFWQGALSSEDILIVSGAQQGIDIVSKVLINVNDNIVVERPTYSGALTVFNWRRANIIEIDMLEDGADLDKFEKVLKKTKIKCFYTMSYFQNPTGISYSIEKKLRLLELAEKYNFFIIEDDYLSELIFDNKIKYNSFRSLDKKDRVIYIKSFSKIFLPGIRIGYMVFPLKYRELIQNSKINTDISTSSLMQRALDLYLRKGYWENYIEFLKKEYLNRYMHMERTLQESLSSLVEFKSPGGGMNFFIKIKDEVPMNCRELFVKAKEEGVLITPGVMFYKNPLEGDSFFRLGFSQTYTEDITRGIHALKNILGKDIL